MLRRSFQVIRSSRVSSLLNSPFIESSSKISSPYSLPANWSRSATFYRGNQKIQEPRFKEFQDDSLSVLKGKKVEIEPGSNPDKLFKSIELELLAYESGVLDSYEWFVRTAASHLGIKISKIPIPWKRRFTPVRWNLLRCVHIYKKAQLHYECRTYHLILILHRLTGSTADTFLEYIERNLPEGVGLKVTKVEVQALPEYLQKPISQQPESESSNEEKS